MHLLKSRVPKLWLTARRNRQEIITAGLSRRELFKMGLLTSGGYLAAKELQKQRGADDFRSSGPRAAALDW